MKILIIDDSFFARKIIKSFIAKDQGYEISEAENGKEGLEKFKEVCPDVTFLDLQMPVMGGIECLKEIMQVDSKAKVIVVTAAIKSESTTKVEELGAFRRINKPPTKEEIVRALMDVQA